MYEILDGKCSVCNWSITNLTIMVLLLTPNILKKPRIAHRTQILLIRPCFDTSEAEWVRASIDPGEYVVGGLLEADAACNYRLFSVTFSLNFLLEMFVERLGNDDGGLFLTMGCCFGVGLGCIPFGLCR